MGSWLRAMPKFLRQAAPGLMLLALFVSAVAVVGVKQHARALNTQAQELIAEREQLAVEYNQLRLERGTIGAHARIEALATDQLNMEVPQEYAIVQVPAAD